METIMKQAAAYLRVSTDGQDTRAQRSKIEEYALANDYNVERWFVDEALSGTLDDRPQLLELKDWVPQNEGKAVLMVGIDRLARDFVIYADFTKLFEDYRINAVYLNCPKIGEPSIDTLLQNILAAFAAYEKDVIRSRLDNGKRFKIKNGIISAGGPALYGYKFRIVYHPDGKKDKFYEIEEKEAEIVRMIFRMLLSGKYKVQTIGREMTRLKIENRNGITRWAPTSIRSMLANTTYMGEYRYGKTKMSGVGRNRKEIPRATEEQLVVKVPFIINKIDFDKAQRILDNLARGGGRKSKKYTYVLGGLIKCGLCSYRYSGWKKDTKKEVERYFYYRCNSINRYNIEGKHKSCGNPSIDGKRADEAVWNSLIEILTNPGKIHQEIDRKKNREEGRALNENLKIISKRMDGIKEQKKRIMDGYARGLFTDEEVVQYKKELKKEAIALILKSNEISEQMYIRVMEYSDLVDGKIPPIEELKEYSYERRRELIQKYISEIKVNPTKPQTLEVTFNLPVKPKTVIVTSSNSPPVRG